MRSTTTTKSTRKTPNGRMFAKAKGPESLPPHILAAFPNTRGRPKLPEAKQAVSIRLSPDVLAHYKALGAGWQARVNEVLREATSQKRSA